MRGRARLLLIDDDEGMRKYLSRVAEECGYDVTAVDRDSAFRKAYEASPPELILLDIFMPHSDGFEILADLKKRASPVPIVLISGHESFYLEAAERFGEANGLNIIGALQKPIRAENLRALLRRTAQGN